MSTTVDERGARRVTLTHPVRLALCAVAGLAVASQLGNAARATTCPTHPGPENVVLFLVQFEELDEAGEVIAVLPPETEVAGESWRPYTVSRSEYPSFMPFYNDGWSIDFQPCFVLPVGGS